MYCTTCGKELPDGTRICDECGTRFTPEGKSEEIEHRPYMDYQPFSGQSDGPDPQTAEQESPQTDREPGTSYGQSGPSPYGQGNGPSPYGQIPYQANPYGRYPERDPEGPDRTGMAVAGLVIGIISVCCCCIPLLNIPLGILAVIFGVLGMKSSYRGLAIAGLVLGVISLVLGLMMLLLLVMEDGFHFSYYWDLFE